MTRNRLTRPVRLGFVLLILLARTSIGGAAALTSEELSRARHILSDPNVPLTQKRRCFDLTVDRGMRIGSSIEEARFLGDYILHYPEIALESYRRGTVSLAIGAFTSPETTHAFLKGHPDNILFVLDLFAAVDRQPPRKPEYFAVMQNSLERVLRLPESHWQKWLSPEGARTLKATAFEYLLWANTLSRDVAWEAMKVISTSDPGWAKRATHRTLEAFGIWPTKLVAPVSAAYSYLSNYMKQAGDDTLITEFLIQRAELLRRPHSEQAWPALADAQTLSEAQANRLRKVWKSQALSKYARFVIESEAKPLLNRLFPNAKMSCATEMR